MSDGNARELIDTRQQTHGEWAITARVAQKLKACLEDEIISTPRLQHLALSFEQREALDMILAKIARIVSGDPNHPDHWADISGYSLLALQALGRPEGADPTNTRRSSQFRAAPTIGATRAIDHKTGGE